MLRHCLDKLLFLKTLAMKHDEKYQRDVELIVKQILDVEYAQWCAALSEEEERRYLTEQ